MTIRAQRRTTQKVRLEDRSDSELLQIWFFRSVTTEPQSVRYTEEESRRASEILKQREAGR